MTGNIKVKIRRIELGISQAGLTAKVAGIWPPDLTRIESHGWIPPLVLRQRIARALKTTPAVLWPDVDSK